MKFKNPESPDQTLLLKLLQRDDGIPMTPSSEINYNTLPGCADQFQVCPHPCQHFHSE